MRFLVTLAMFLPAVTTAHHSVLHYDGKKEIVIEGIVTAGRFAFPHSIYKISVTNDAGGVEEWILSTEDPRDAERLGFADELQAIEVGDQIKVVGWPHRFTEKEIRGHQLHYPDGRVVFMRRGNYIWPEDVMRLDRYYYNPDTLDGVVSDIDASLPQIDQVLAWIEEGDPVARAAFESVAERPRLIGVQEDSDAIFAGVEELLICHTQRPEFVMELQHSELSRTQQEALTAGSAYIAEYNRLLSRWWEQEHSSCEP